MKPAAPYIIAVAGKGGVGKTTVSALLIRRLADPGRPVLAVDADPNSNLNMLLGLEYEDTISDIREEAKNLSSSSLSKSDFFNLRLQEAVAEGNGVDLLVMGRPEGPGCYCAVNNILRDYLSRLSKNYAFVVIDNEAGMEHLSRRTANSIDLLLLISDTTAVGMRSAVNAFDTARRSGLKINRASLLINKSKGALYDAQLKAAEQAGLTIGGYVSFQEGIRQSSESGGSMPRTEDKDLDRVISDLIRRDEAVPH